MYLQPPTEKYGLWTTIMRFDTAEHLEAWMDAPERTELLAQSKAFIDHEQLMRLATSFPGWVPINPMTGKGPPNWKTALLVILGLFPIVMLEMRFLSPILTSRGLYASLAFVTMPLCIRWFDGGFSRMRRHPPGSRPSASDSWRPSLPSRLARSGICCPGDRTGKLNPWRSWHPSL